MATTDSNHNWPVAEHLLKQESTVQVPNHNWIGDVAYLCTDKGWAYLPVVLDLCQRQAVGSAMDKTMTANLACDAVRMAP